MKKKVYTYILNKQGKPLMPTTRCGHVRRLLKSKKAVVIKTNPFTIRLKYTVPDEVQDIFVGIDTGRENIGIGASDFKGNCLYLSELSTSNKSISFSMDKRENYRKNRRQNRRQRKKRKVYHYTHTQMKKEKEAKFYNRKRYDGWLTPSGNQCIQMHMATLNTVVKILPITHLTMEVTYFRTKLEKSEIHSFTFVPNKGDKSKLHRYIFELQNGKCLLCNTNKIEEYHHIIPRSKHGSNCAKNTVGLCKSCHDKNHKDLLTALKLSTLKKGAMKNQISLLTSIMNPLVEQMSDFCEQYQINFSICRGYQTAAIREHYKLPKEHCIDGYCCSIFNREQLTPINITKFIYVQKRFKKKSKEIIKKNNSRIYKHNGKIVARNRHKATEQKDNSLEEYMLIYSKTHTKKECDRHMHELEIIPAKRNYTYHKRFQEGLETERPLIHVGDIVRYEKVNKTDGKIKKSTFVAREVEYSQTHKKVRHSDKLEGRSMKGKLLKFCHSIESGATACIGKKELILQKIDQ